MATDTEVEPTPPAAPSAVGTFVGTFSDLDIPEGILKGTLDLGYKGPTQVQAAVFLPARSGRDVMVQSRTGSGKTTAFCLPVLCGIDPAKKSPQALVLAPTRELALQVSAEASRLGHHAGIRVVTIYGGASMRAQIDALQAGAHFVVGTPGRVKDLHRQGYLRFEGIKFSILDEADEMLSRGFWEEVTSILDQLPDQRQSMLFSATLPEQIERAASKYLKDPERIDLSRDTVNVSTIRHVLHHESEKFSKPRNFLHVLEFHKPQSAIVFCNRKDETEMITSYLRRFGFRAEALNGDMPQSARERTLARVKAGELDLMVATDIAARGIDISDLGHVFNYDLPEHDEVYVHRVGRTGRIGKKGIAVSLVRGKYMAHLANLQKQFKVPFEDVQLPDEKEILWMQAERLAVQILEAADGVEMEQYRPVAEAMLARGDVKEILSFLLRTHFSHERASRPAGEGESTPRPPRPDREPRERRPDRPDRPDRPERSERRPRMDEGPPPDGAVAAGGGADAPAIDELAARNLYVSLGREDGINDLIELAQRMGDLCGVDTAHFTGEGTVRDHSSHVEVDAEVADKIIAGVHGKPRPGKTMLVEGNPEPVPATIVCELGRGRGPRRDGGDRGDRGDRGGRGGGGGRGGDRGGRGGPRRGR